MSLIDTIRKDREELARVVKKHRGIRKLVEDLYPDKAHFLYELLQNAEDAGAQNVRFQLEPDRLLFEHDGSRYFEERDVWGITDIGEGTKADDEGTIGKFGIGFKAVFGYTESPKIWSPGHSFEIKELFLPHELPTPPDLGACTRFEFPFNNPKKDRQSAFREILEGLGGLPDMTLLFLRNIQSLEWTCSNGDSASIRRKQQRQRTTIHRCRNGEVQNATDFLVFTRDWPEHPKQFVSVAYELEPRADAKAGRVSMASQFRIVPSTRGTVSVYFVAEKETSNLRFHLHAPFVTGLDRASVKDVEANHGLYDALAELASQSLLQIKSAGLLDLQFLAVLPNEQDDLAPTYATLRDAIVEICGMQPLIPTDDGDYATSGNLQSGPSQIRTVFTHKELAFLTGGETTRWARGIKSHTREYYFLKTAGVPEWSWDDLDESIDDHFYQPSAAATQWLQERPTEWMQRFYQLLAEGYQKGLLESPESSRLLRTRCAGERTTHPFAEGYYPKRGFPEIPQAEPALLQDADGQPCEKTREALATLGVLEIGTGEKIGQILKDYYFTDDDADDDKKELTGDLHIRHMQAFIDYFKDTASTTVFEGYALFFDCDNAPRWSELLFLDEPFEKTGLHSIFQHPGFPGLETKRLWPRYAGLEGFEEFARACGVHHEIQIQRRPAFQHPEFLANLHSPGNPSEYCIDEDYAISGLQDILHLQCAQANHRIWKRLCAAEAKVLEARYQPNKRSPLKTDRSSLCVALANASWIPDTEGQFHKPAEIAEEQLHPDFLYRNANGWLDAIHFGEHAKQQSEEYIQLKESSEKLGIPPALLKELQELNDQDRDEMAEEILQSLKERKSARRYSEDEEDNTYHAALEQGFTDDGDDTPTQAHTGTGGDAPSAEHRRKRVAEEISADKTQGTTNSPPAATGVKWKPRNKNVRMSLQQWYGGRCQICKQLPFTKKNGEPYFEGVYLVSRTHADWIDRVGNVLCLCPLHSAQLQHGPKEIQTPMAQQILSGSPSIHLRLCGQDVEITYAEKHRIDLEEMLKASMAPD